MDSHNPRAIPSKVSDPVCVYMQVPLPNLANLPNMPNLANLPNIPGMPMGFPGSRPAEGTTTHSHAQSYLESWLGERRRLCVPGMSGCIIHAPL